MFAWELGDNFGHLARDLGVACELRAAGHEVIFAVRDIQIAEQLLTPCGFGFIPAPMAVRVIRLALPAANYSEILIARGYADRATVRGLVRAWRQLFQLAKPDAIVIDHAPTAILAARTCAIPTLLLGSGFEIPPNGHPLPPIRPWERYSRQRLEIADRTVLLAMNSALAEHKAAMLTRVSELFGSSAVLLATFPELDHYGPRSDREYLGPLSAEPPGPAIDWHPEPRVRVFVYVRAPFTGFGTLLSALSAPEFQAICVMPGISAQLKKSWENERTRIFSQRISMQSLLGNAGIIVNHGGSSTIASALLAGVPMLLIPRTVEQILASRLVGKMGAGIILPPQPTASVYSDALHKLSADAGFRESARKVAADHRDFNLQSSLKRAASAIAELAAAAPAPPRTH